MAFALSALAQQHENEIFSDRDLTEAGFAAASTVDDFGRNVLTYKHLKSGRLLQVTYSLAGSIEEMIETTAGGRLVDRRYFYPGMFVHEVFEPEHILKIEQNHNGELSEIETTRWKNGKPTTTTLRFKAREHASDAKCSGLPLPVKDLKDMKDLITNPKWVKLKAGKSEKDGMYDLGSNILADKDCDKNPKYPGGVKGLAKDLQSAMRKGIKCLAKQTDPDRQMEAARIAALLKGEIGKPYKIFCGKPGKVTAKFKADNSDLTIASNEFALAHTCSLSDQYPGMHINTSNMRFVRKSEERQSMLFHEAVHLLGHGHSDAGFDMAYLAQYCCFALKEKKAACNIMAQAGKKSWTSVDYQRAYAKIMAANFKSDHAFRTGWRMVSEVAPPAPGALVESMLSFKQYPLKRALYAQGGAMGASDLISTSLRKRIESEILDAAFPSGGDDAAKNELIRKLVIASGNVIGAALKNDSTSLATSLTSFSTTAAEACKVMSEDQKVELYEVVSQAWDTIDKVKGDIDTKLLWLNSVKTCSDTAP